ncbi:hypothetical protein GCG54_00014274 [Colletotrichum gloeosporioides]|uniref:Stress-response A/B barrel domain-containing protein n=1 Tax=Colletotrichum gloeosporioides TaxID=474922 RepID=A0A8H4CEW3_COLGL|nr:uncharacterized protein GCG54_00014274 [Colletotrichum gloeosporioides]KAF3802568.1 hypothetical protein GCG54_00014274 [Colletotrichum gloeosporioides]
MPFIHIVLMRFKSDSSPAEIEKALKRSWDLQHECVHPSTQKPYIISIVSGKNSSIVPNKYGFTHSTKIEFENAEDCAYFIKEDPAHKVLFPMFHSLTEEILVMDYTPGCLDV